MPLPFPHPTNDAQRRENARAQAAEQGKPYGSGYLNLHTMELQDPDRGFMRYIGNHPALGMALALAPAAPFLLGAGGAGGASGVIAGTGIPTVAGAGGAAAGVGAAAGAGVAGMSPATLAILGGQSLLSLYGAKKQADASTRAAEIQAGSAREALGLTRDIYNTTRSDLAPYNTYGQGAIAKLGTKLGVTPTGQQQTAPQAQGGQMVTIQAPTGQTKQVPAGELSYWTSRGARQVS